MKFIAKFMGSPALLIDGAVQVFPFKKAQVLALMLIEEKSISRDKLCEFLWGDKPIEKARRNLSNAISYVRKIIPVNLSSGGMIEIDQSAKIERDIDHISRMESMEWSKVREICSTFMDDTDLDDLPSFGDWLMPKRQYYHSLVVRNLKKSAQQHLAGFSENRYEEAIRCYEMLAEYEPYDEKIYGELVRLYIKTNQKVKAVNTARTFSARIENDFGIEANLSDIATLMKRQKESAGELHPARTPDENPLARNEEILRMLDFIAKNGENSISSCSLVFGEQGIGKTVFVNEIVSCLTQRSWECYSIVCYQEEKNYPLAPVMRFLKTIKVPAEKFEDFKSLSELNYSYIAELIYQRLASQKDHPKLLVIENIQWLDDASWAVIELIMCDNSSTRHILASGFEEVRSSFMLRTTLADEPFEKLEIILRRFNLEETGRICHEMAPEEDWSNEKIHDIYMQTEGNPYFIKELLKNRIDGTLHQGNTNKNAFVSMIELLDDDSRLFLEAIAVCPECASMQEISQVLEISPLNVATLYNNLKLHGFLREQCSGNGDVLYYFTHAKIREALTEGMSASRRISLHMKNIEILEDKYRILQYRHKNICTRIYIHCHEAGFRKKELYWQVKELELHFMAAHEVFPTLVDQDLMHYIPTADDVSYTNRTINTAWETMNSLFRTDGGSPELLKIERDLYILKGGYLWWSGHYSDSEQMLRSAVHKAIAIGEPEPIIKAGIQLCYLAIQRDNARLLSFCASRLCKFAAQTGFSEWEGTCCRFMAIAYILAGQHDKVEKHLLRSTMIFEKLENRGKNYTVCLIAAEHFRGDWMLSEGKIPEALSHYENCVNIGESIALFRGLGLSLAKAAFCLMLLKNYDSAENYLQRMGKIYNIMHSEWEDGLQGGGIAYSLMGLINCRKGDWYHGGICLDVAKKLVKETRRPTWQAVLYWAKVELFDMKDKMPPDFAKVTLCHEREWYEEQLNLLRHKVGWIK